LKRIKYDDGIVPTSHTGIDKRHVMEDLEEANQIFGCGWLEAPLPHESWRVFSVSNANGESD